MTNPMPESDAIKSGTKAAWDAQAEGWHRRTGTLAQYLDPPSEMMLDMIGLNAGDQVLDVAAGSGGQTLLAARRVGPSGFVLATDLSPHMLAFAETEVQRAGLTNVETRVMDAENLQFAEESFDAAIVRGGLEFVPDPQKALASMRSVVRTGKKVGVVAFSTPDKCPHVAVPASIIAERAQIPPPPPGAPGLFRLARPGLLQELFEGTGFRDIQVVAVTTYLRLSSAAECVQLVQDVGGAVRPLLARLSDTERQELWTAVEQALRRYEGPSGFEAPCEFLVAVGTK